MTQTFAILVKRGVGKNLHSQLLVEELLGAGAQVVIAVPVVASDREASQTIEARRRLPG